MSLKFTWPIENSVVKSSSCLCHPINEQQQLTGVISFLQCLNNAIAVITSRCNQMWRWQVWLYLDFLYLIAWQIIEQNYPARWSETNKFTAIVHSSWVSIQLWILQGLSLFLASLILLNIWCKNSFRHEWRYPYDLSEPQISACRYCSYKLSDSRQLY